MRDLVKESIFNILNHSNLFTCKIENGYILDLFSGTGNIAFEFASRGCEDITAIDQNFHCTKFISKMAEELNCKMDVRKKMFQYGLKSNQIDNLIKELIAKNIINDERFSFSFLNF